MGTLLLGILGAFLVGGAVSLYRQKAPKIAWIACAALAVASFAAAWAVSYR